MNELLLLCVEFFKTGLFAVGGGMATIPFLTQMAEAHPHWFTIEMLADMIAVSESTPGPIGVNMATYVGYTVAGVPGAVVCTLSLAAPSLIVILLIAKALDKYNQNQYVQWSFHGLRPAVTGLIAAAGFTVWKLALFGEGGMLDWRLLLLFLAVLFGTQWKKLSKLHPIAYIGVAALAGVVLKL